LHFSRRKLDVRSISDQNDQLTATDNELQVVTKELLGVRKTMATNNRLQATDNVLQMGTKELPEVDALERELEETKKALEETKKALAQTQDWFTTTTTLYEEKSREATKLKADNRQLTAMSTKALNDAQKSQLQTSVDMNPQLLKMMKMSNDPRRILPQTPKWARFLLRRRHISNHGRRKRVRIFSTHCRDDCANTNYYLRLYLRLCSGRAQPPQAAKGYGSSPATSPVMSPCVFTNRLARFQLRQHVRFAKGGRLSAMLPPLRLGHVLLVFASGFTAPAPMDTTEQLILRYTRRCRRSTIT
jgi:hypothetical protein